MKTPIYTSLILAASATLCIVWSQEKPSPPQSATITKNAPAVTIPDGLPKHYQTQNIEGWSVHVDDKLLANKQWDACKKVLASQLLDTKRRLPANVTKEMQKVPIFFDLKVDVNSCACYHPSKTWLVTNGYPAAKAKSIELNDPDKFLSWTIQQPYMLMHELAHAYHHQVLNFQNPEIIKLYNDSMKPGTYDKTFTVRSTRQVKHYAITNHKEYFAESVEAYYGCNDFFPFVRSELKKHDPAMHQFLTKKLGANR